MRLAASVRRFVFVTTSLVPVALAAATLAPAARAADADQVRSDLAAVLDEMFAVGTEKGMVYDGIDVEGDSAPFNVAVRGVKLGSPAEGFADLGTVTLTIVPTGEGLYEIGDLKLPTSISHTAPEDALEDAGKVDATIEVGAQSFKGVWSMPMRSFISFDGSLDSLRALDGDGAEVLTVASVLLDGDSTETTPGRWDQDGTVKVSGLQITSPEDGTVVTIGEMSVGTLARNVDVQTFQEMMDKIEAAGIAVQSEFQQPGEDAPIEDAPIGDAPVELPADETPADDMGAEPVPPAEGDALALVEEDAAAAAAVEAGSDVAADPNAGADQAGSEAAADDSAGDAPLADLPAASDEPEAMMPETAPEDAMMLPDVPSPEMSPVQAKALQDMMEALQGIPTSIGDVSSNIALRDLVVRNADGAERFKLGSAALEFSATGLDKEKSGMRFAYSHAGLDADWNVFNSEDDDSFDSFEEMDSLDGTEGSADAPAPELEPEPLDAQTEQLIDQLAPREFVLDLQLQDVPSKELWNTFVSTFYSGATGGSEPTGLEMEMMGAMLPMMLAQAGSTVRIVDSRIVTDAASIAFDGAVKADPASMMGASGTVTVEVIGLDKVIDLAKTYLGPEGAADAAPLEMLRAFGERTQAEGTTVDRYLITLEPNGALMLNGKDMNFLLGGMGAPPQ